MKIMKQLPEFLNLFVFLKVVSATLVSLLLFLNVSLGQAFQSDASSISKAEMFRIGEQMYLNGILPSGKPMGAFLGTGVELDKSAYSCASCHFRAGLGSVEEGIIAPSVSGNKLYKPFRRTASQFEKDKQKEYSKTILERPAYNRESLATAIRSGINPAGQKFNVVMPRYPLSNGDMDILISFLERLSSEPSPGATDSLYKFATIISDDVSQEDRQALLIPLQRFIDRKNHQKEMYNEFIKFGYVPTPDMQFAFRNASLDIWELKGPSETWQKQLAGYYKNNQVFAVLGGISNSSWKPVHDFCETERIPCLFPITDLPVVSETAWYTYYFNKGYVQEGEASARYLNRMESISAKTVVLQIVQDSAAGKALAEGFLKNWKELERPDATTLMLTDSQLLDEAYLNKLLKKYKPEVLLLWTDSSPLNYLPGLVHQLEGQKTVFISSKYFGKKTAMIDESIRKNVFITFPYRLKPYVGPKTGGFDSKKPIYTTYKDLGERRVFSQSTTILNQATLQGLNLIYDNLYRDHLLDVMSMQMDVFMQDFERISFGADQRFVSKGCYIIQLGPGAEPELLPRSEWVIH